MMHPFSVTRASDSPREREEFGARRLKQDPLFLHARALSQDLLRMTMFHARLAQGERQALQRCRLGRAQAVILQLLAQNAAEGVLSLSELQDRLAVSKQSLHSSLSRLLAEGYVERKEPRQHDRRRVVVALSAKGRALEERLLARRLVVLRSAYRSLPASQVEGFRSVLAHLASSAQTTKSKPTP